MRDSESRGGNFLKGEHGKGQRREEYFMFSSLSSYPLNILHNQPTKG
jgi:hypothetical protein